MPSQRTAATWARRGSVLHMFSKKGVIAIEKSAATEEKLMDIVLEHGGEDLNDEGDTWEIITDPAAYEGVLAAVKAAGIPTGDERGHHDRVHVYEAGRRGGEPDGAPARSA